MKPPKGLKNFQADIMDVKLHQMKYRIKVTVKSGYMLFTQEANSPGGAKALVLERLLDAGWGLVHAEVVE